MGAAAESLEAQRRHLLEHAGRAGVPGECLAPVVEHLLPLYAEADAAAIRCAGRFRGSALIIYALSALAVTISIGQWLFLPERHAVIWLEVLAMVLALFLIEVSRRREWHRRWLHDRHLAEQLRSAMFLLMVPGGRVEVGRRSGEVLPFYAGPDPLLTESVRQALGDGRLAACSGASLEATRRFLADGWIRDQARFHGRNQRLWRGRSHRLHGSALVLFLLTMVAAALHALGAGAAHPPAGTEGAPSSGRLAGVLVLLTIALPAAAAALHGIGELFDWERLGERSRRMAALLDEKALALERAASAEEVLAIALEAERIMAIENYEWLVSLSFQRPPAVPT